MYPQILRGDYNTKPKPRENSKYIANKNKTPPLRLCEQSELIVAYKEVVDENKLLKDQIEVLSSDSENLRERNEELTVLLNETDEKLKKQINQLNEELLNAKKSLEENKMNFQYTQNILNKEIIDLSQEILTLQIKIREKDKQLENILKLEKQMEDLKVTVQQLNKERDELQEKSTKYKEKVKYSVTVINDLNNLLVEATKKPEVTEAEIQTVEELNTSNSTTNSTTSNSSSPYTTTIRCGGCVAINDKLKTEEMILSDIFFKPRSFGENDNVLLKRDSWGELCNF